MVLVDVEGLNKYIKSFNFNSNIFSFPLQDQAKLYTDVLIGAFDKFVPKRTIQIRHSEPPWCNRYTRLLMRKKNRNYNFLKRAKTNLTNTENKDNISDETITSLKSKVNKACKNYKISSKESLNAHRRVKQSYYNTVNNTMINTAILAKKKFQILIKLMNNQKFSMLN